MKPTQLDTLSIRLAKRVSRRTALRGGGSGLAAAALGTIASNASAQTATQSATSAPGGTVHPEAADNVKAEYLFTQTFEGGSWRPKPGTANTYTLTLTAAAAETTYFSDRPERVVGLAPMDKFLAGFGFTPANPPNAALVAAPSDDGNQDVLVIELMNPVYDASAGTLTYDARVLANYEGTGLAFLAQQQQDFDFAEHFGAGGLFIDDCPDGHAICKLVDEADEYVVGEIYNVGCCFKGGASAACGLCNDDGTSWYYGMLCNRVYPDQCIYIEHSGPDGGPAWGCNAKDLYCHD